MTNAALSPAGLASPDQPADGIQATRQIARIPERFPGERVWAACFGVSLCLLVLFLISAYVLFANGIGVWGNNMPVNWGLAIANYIFFVGIGHAGTLISAMLLLLNEQWRNALNRFAEAMTLVAVVCAGLYPILHLGRFWRFYWMAPYPNTMDLWPQFKSPLTWDFFAVLTYLTVSLLFWYIGLVPDLATMRDRAKSRRGQVLYGLFALGWRGSARHWARWRQAYRLTAAIAVPLVVSVHSEISLLFAAGPIPGWTSTVFPPYFVLGAAFSGFAVVSMISVTLRYAFRLEHIVTERHLDLLGQLTLACGLMTSFGYLAEVFDALYSGDPYDLATLHDRVAGAYAGSYWGAVLLNFVPLQLLWAKRFRTTPLMLFSVGACVTVGMWLERYMLLFSTLFRDYLVSSYGSYTPSFWEWSLFIGMIGGVFFLPFLLFVRFLPMSSAFELKEAEFEENGERQGEAKEPVHA